MAACLKPLTPRAFDTLPPKRRSLLAQALSDAGTMILQSWITISRQFQAVVFDEYVIMPNHLHAIRTIQPRDADAPALGTIIQAFKRLSTNRYFAGVNEHGWPRFTGRL